MKVLSLKNAVLLLMAMSLTSCGWLGIGKQKQARSEAGESTPEEQSREIAQLKNRVAELERDQHRR